jgi:hypothetical protein
MGRTIDERLAQLEKATKRLERCSALLPLLVGVPVLVATIAFIYLQESIMYHSHFGGLGFVLVLVLIAIVAVAFSGKGAK